MASPHAQKQPPHQQDVPKGAGMPSEVHHKPVQAPMVGWYHVPQLVRTGIAVVTSTIFGRHSDHRLMEAVGSNPSTIYDYTCHYQEDSQGKCEPEKNRPRQEIWIDYVGDVGDGWNPTYAIAYYLAQSELRFKNDVYDPTGDERTLRGDLLIFGGDEVYPAASREEYETRLLGPYETALRATKTPPYPHVFAIPGNHDWYDSLASFIRLFTSRQWFGGWRTRQKRSYFALKFPHHWWLLGTDLQLGSDIDWPQVEYFLGVAAEIEKDQQSRIILCYAEPHWVYKQMYQGQDPAYSEANLAFLEKRLGRTVDVFLAGDQHHYRHYATHGTPTTQIHKITAGGGGAFLHPTHTGRKGRKLQELKEEKEKTVNYDRVQSGRTFYLKKCFPTEEESRRLCWRTLIFPYLNANYSWTFGLLTAGLYLLSTMSLLGNLQEFPLWSQSHVPQLCDDCWQLLGRWTSGTFAQLIGWTLDTVVSSPLTMFWILLMVAGFLLFTDTHYRDYRLKAGLLHALCHVFAAFIIAVGSIALVMKWTACVPHIMLGGYRVGPDWRVVVAAIPFFLFGYVIRSLTMGAYLAAFIIAVGSIAFVMERTSPACVSHIMLGGYRFDPDWRVVFAAIVIILGGYVVGSLIMGAYLLVSLNWFGRHWNEAFSALAIQDWKNFLRLHIDREGNLKIYPIGLRRVPRRWKNRKGQTGPELEPDDPKATQPFLIEKHIKVGLKAQ